jgi:hypothetical protein
MAEQIIAWTHNTATSGDGTIPVIVHASRKQLLVVLHEDLSQWHEATPEEYERFEHYWAKAFPHMGQYIIKEHEFQ